MKVKDAPPSAHIRLEEEPNIFGEQVYLVPAQADRNRRVREMMRLININYWGSVWVPSSTRAEFAQGVSND